MDDIFRNDDSVLLYYSPSKSWIKRVTNSEFHTNFGYVNLNDIKGKAIGSTISTNTGKTFYLLKPGLTDWIKNFKHGSQIIYEKDAAAISLLLDLSGGKTVIEAGTGSGALTAVVANIVGPTGKIFTFDNREVALETAKRNLQQLKYTNIQFHLKDVFEDGFLGSPVDAMFLDLGDPWRVAGHISSNLKVGGKLVAFLPTFNQIEKTWNVLRDEGFIEIIVKELIERNIQLKDGAIRPSTRMIGHTGYLLSARYLMTNKEIT